LEINLAITRIYLKGEEMQQKNSGCMTALVSSMSRWFLLFAWIGRPVAFDAAFGSWIIPCLGFLFLPFTTLMYLILITNGVTRTISGMDWLWLIFAVILDLASIAAAGATNRDRIPQGYPGSIPPEPPAAPPATPAQ
jgi:hypothetical protein